MNTIKWLLTASFIAGTGVAAAQQGPLPPAPAEKIAPQTNDGSNSPASRGAIGGALNDGADAAVRKRTDELSEGSRTGELQENRGRTETTGQAPTREQNRVSSEKKSDRAGSPKQGSDPATPPR
jgi:hypothetical protein